MINALSEYGLGDSDYCSVLNITLIFDDDGKELKKKQITGLGKES